MSEESFISVKSQDKFFLNGERFYVFYKERGNDDEVSLLGTNYFDIEETDVGYEIVVKKVGGYVGLNIPVFSDLIVGNQFFNIKRFNEKFFCYNKVNFDGAFEFSENDYTDVYYPIIHNVIDENKALSISPSSGEEVIINSYRDYFKDYMRMQTYSHYQNDYVRFFLDVSSNYHLNLRRVSDSEGKSLEFDNQNSIVEYQDALFNNLDVLGNNGEFESSTKSYLKKFTKFIKEKLKRRFVLQGKASLWLNGYTNTAPNNVEGILGIEKDIDFYQARVKLLNEIREADWIDVKDVSKISKRDSFIVIQNSGVRLKIYFSQNWKGYKNRVDEDSGMFYLTPEAELERCVLEYQSAVSSQTSQKRKHILRQRIEKYAWKVKTKKDFSEDSIFNLIAGISDKEFDDYFKNFYKEFNLRTFNRIRKNVLDDVERSYVDVRVNEPFFVSVYEDVYSYYFVIVNSEYTEQECRMVFGKHFDNSKWIGLQKNKSSDVVIDKFMEHREIYIDDIKFGGVLLASK